MDHPHEACAVFGIFAPGEDVARLTFFALYALQHRGQESAGIAVVDQAGEVQRHVGMGLVSQVFSEDHLARLQGNLAIGHNRYSTTGSSRYANAQPLVVSSSLGPLALAHNGKRHQRSAPPGKSSPSRGSRSRRAPTLRLSLT
ncbi:MAG: hypothetical protein KatS3mg061_2231 [Dehalococcoidia bacterium]|nr:MAG: hypothetical protein KatS3mg061_2231 [Dehalococcoidia bacterium]